MNPMVIRFLQPSQTSSTSCSQVKRPAFYPHVPKNASSNASRHSAQRLGARKQAIDGVEVLPLADFLSLLPGEPG